MHLENLPAAFGTQVGIIDIESAATAQHAHGFENVGIAVPAFEVHEHNGAIDNVDRVRRYGLQIVAVDFRPKKRARASARFNIDLHYDGEAA